MNKKLNQTDINTFFNNGIRFLKNFDQGKNFD